MRTGSRGRDPVYDHELIRMLISEGRMDLKEIAARVGCSYRTVNRVKANMPDQDRKPITPPYPPELFDRARTLLEDRTGYREAAATLGVQRETLARNLPGYALTRAESLERAAMGRQFNATRTYY